ncbi:undecaprenyl-diphosphate phosphatase [Mammaliicoccus lentus]|uniref:Undecaprenyl-diphosphatase n=1 Tax=Mammaliicoccus lentus TaxID=42858 RepID=A0ABS6GV52_MAMLE|nr:undecaprenyl-diphosphate phosphatase [Mammaliicoccus lentus]MBU6113335.1 undecaprenyl-diphosphate phosphatase [Mammaliicoccus lentus]
MFIIELIKAIILGIVEGLTEFAPVSSTGHQILIDDMWLKSKAFLGSESAFTFKVVVQLGSILAAAWIFRSRYIEMLHVKQNEKKKHHLKLSHIIIGLVPAGILGLLFDDFIEKHLFSVPTVLIGLLLGAVYMIGADIYSKRVMNPHTVDGMNYPKAFVIGLSQAIALWPGFSRSGSTISTGVFLKLDHKAASNFTFIMAVPIMFAASGKALLGNLKYITLDQIPFYIVGFIASFIFGFISIKLFLKLINRVKLIPFAIYRIILVIIIAIAYFGFGIGQNIG